jgi:TolA-binding protein
MDRQHRQDLKHDKFVDEIGTLSTRARENQRLLLTITAAAVAIAVIAYGIVFYRSNREEKAQAALSAAIDTMDSPLLPANPEPGQQPPVGAKYRTEAERNGVAEKQFRAVQSSYSGTDAADVSKLYLARLDASRGDIASARTLLQQFISDHPKHILVGTARYSLYQLRIDNGEAAQVVSEVNAEVNKTDPILPSDTLLVVLAHAYASQGDEAKSRDAYKRIATEFPDSPYALEAQRRMGPA